MKRKVEMIDNAMAERFKEARTYFGLSYKKMAEKCGISQSHYRLIEKGRSSANFTCGIFIGFEKLGINTNWLITGEGEMLNDNGKFKENIEKQLKEQVKVTKKTYVKPEITENENENNDDYESYRRFEEKKYYNLASNRIKHKCNKCKNIEAETAKTDCSSCCYRQLGRIIINLLIRESDYGKD